MVLFYNLGLIVLHPYFHEKWPNLYLNLWISRSFHLKWIFIPFLSFSYIYVNYFSKKKKINNFEKAHKTCWILVWGALPLQDEDPDVTKYTVPLNKNFLSHDMFLV